MHVFVLKRTGGELQGTRAAAQATMLLAPQMSASVIVSPIGGGVVAGEAL